MSSYIQKIRAKPVKERQKLVYIIAGSVTLFIVLFWITLLKFDSFHSDKEVAQKSEQGPFSVLMQNFSHIWSSSIKYKAELDTLPTAVTPGAPVEDTPSETATTSEPGGQIIAPEAKTDTENTVQSTPITH